MPLPSPNLDDRTFEQLVEDARRRIQHAVPEWTDLSANDPGIVLLELFAHLTEEMVRRLNRLPDKAYVEFLRLIGVRIGPPAAASVLLRFERSRVDDRPLEIPKGTRVTVSRAESGREPPIFVTTESKTIAPGEKSVEVLAWHCEVVDAELIGKGTGEAGLALQAMHPPIVAQSGDGLDLIVGVESLPDEVDPQAAVVRHGDHIYQIWREVETFANLGAERNVYQVDRMSGKVSFAPGARLTGPDGRLSEHPHELAAVVPADREVRLWYRHGGGPDGNVAANTLTVLRDPIPGVEVTNPEPATGGRAAETLENALTRGPRELHSLQRAVTARDFELIALSSSSGVARAKAITRASLWAHAVPGTVEVLLVPAVPEERIREGTLTIEGLQALESETVQRQIRTSLDERRPLGTTCLVSWSRYKVVRARARIVVRREADKDAVKVRVLDRLRHTINPLPTELNPAGWPFGQALRVSHVFDIALDEPGVMWVDDVRMQVDRVPEGRITSIATDHFQAQTWYAGSDSVLFRSLNDGEGWEPVATFEGESVHRVEQHPHHAGLLAVSTNITSESGSRSRLHLSVDCGETWDAGMAYTMDFEIEDLAWMLRGQDPVLLMATDVGLYELVARQGAVPVPVLVDQADQNKGLYAVVATQDVRGQTSVAIAAQGLGGVYLSSQAGRSGTFRHIGLRNEDVRVLSVQYDGPRSFLWAGVAAAGGDDPGKGCFRWELRGQEDPPDGWRAFSENWSAGSCWGIAFLDTEVVAASFRGGVQRLRLNEQSARWEVPDVRCGLPLRDRGRFQPVDAVAAVATSGLVMAGGSEGIFAGREKDATYRSVSSGEFNDKVTLPPTWLFCSGEHAVEVVSEDDADRD